MKVKVNAETCVGCGLCVNTCGEVFEMKDDKAVAKVAEVPSDKEECCKQAKEECPVEAIIVE